MNWPSDGLNAPFVNKTGLRCFKEDADSIPESKCLSGEFLNHMNQL
jgi:hypothetical protein